MIVAEKNTAQKVKIQLIDLWLYREREARQVSKSQYGIE